MESILFNQVMQLDKPALGICRGIQLFNTLLSGTLYQYIPSDWDSDKKIVHKQPPPYNKPIYDVHIDKGNALYALLKTKVMNVNSYHHQGIKTLSE